jgi:hypothetical protein
MTRWSTIRTHKLPMKGCDLAGKWMKILGAYLETLSVFGSTAGVVTALVAGVE